MNWWNKYKKPVVFILVSLLCVVPLIFVLYALFQIFTGKVFCTLVDKSGNGITVYVENVPRSLSVYEIIVDYPFPMNSDRIVCDESLLTNDSPDFLNTPINADQCFRGGAFFANTEWPNHPPKTLLITVIIEGQKITKRITPTYTLDYLNGEHCPPAYYSSFYFDFGN
ncbi:MAG: hypothetical protein AB1564_07380 [Chloroflexota bacterium]